MKDKFKSLFISLHTWQIILFSVVCAVLITDLITAFLSLQIWHEVQMNLIVLGTINAILVPLIILPVVIRNLRKVVQLEEQNRSHVEMIAQLENQRQIEATLQRRADEMSLLYQLGILFAAGKNLYDTLLILQTEIIKLVQVDTLFVAIYNERTDIVDFPIFFRRGEPRPHSSRRLGERPGLTGGVIYSKKTLYIPDMMAEAVIAQYAPVGDTDLVLRTFLGIPLVVHEKVIGVLSVQSIKIDAYSKDQIQLIENVAVQAATVIDKTSLLDQLKQELKEREYAETQLREREAILESITFAAEEFLKTPNWNSNIDQVLEHLGNTLKVTHVYLFEDHISPQGEPVTSMRYEWTAFGYPSDLDSSYFQNAPIHKEGFEDQVAALMRGDVRVGNSSTFNPIEKESMDELGVKSILEVPILINERIWGAIGFDDFERERIWSNAEVDALKIAAGVLSAAIQRQETESAVRESERIYRQAIEAADAVPYYQDYKSNSYLFMGEGIREMIGYSPDEISPPLWSEIVQETVLLGEAVGLSVAEAIQFARQGKLKTWKCDQKIIRRDGQVRWLTDRSIELLDEKNISYGSIGILQDITDRKLIEANLRQREAILEAVTFAAEQFLKTSEWRTNINNVLERLGKTIDATHAYLFEHHIGDKGTEASSLTYEWTAPGFPSDLDKLYYQNAHPLQEGVDSTDDRLRKGEVFVGNATNFPDFEKERLIGLGVKAMVEVPLFVNGVWWGTIGFDDMVNERNWSPAEVDALKIAAGVLSTAIQRQKADSAVRESEAIYRQAIEAAGAIPYYIDYKSGRYLFMGEGIRQMIGYGPEEMTLALWRQNVQETIMQGEATGLSVPEAAKLIQEGKIKTWRSDVKIRTRDGQQHWLSDSGIELFGDQNISYAGIGILQDITDRKLTEDNLRKRESVLEAITFSAEQFLKTSNWREKIDVVLERLGREFNASHAYLFEKHKGPTGALMSSMTYEWTAPDCVSDLDDPEFQDMLPKPMGFERMYEIMDRGEPLIGSTSFFNALEWEYMQAINVKALLEIRVVVNGEHWGTIGFDDIVHEREWTAMEVDVLKVAANVLGAAIKRQMDEAALQRELDERKRAEQAMRFSEEKFSKAFHTTPVLMTIEDDNGRFIEVNNAFLEALGYEREEVIGHRPSEFNLIPAIEDQKKAGQLQNENGAFKSLELGIRRKSGEVGTVLMSIEFIRVNDMGYTLTSALDITERKQAEAERERLIADLESKNTELERFTYTVSHDLKSPLVTINGFLGYLEQDAASGNLVRLKKDTQRIQEAVNKMQRLLNELLELSRIGRMMNAPELIAFDELVSEAVDIVHGQLETRGVTVQAQPNLPAVYGDKPRLTEVLQNLLDNAVKYMGAQTNPHVEIGQRGDEDGKPIFYVKDNGMGIAPEYHERVFGLFNKLDPRSEGTGVGLALVKRIIEVHGGRIWIESEAGIGSTFLFTLPAKGESR